MKFVNNKSWLSLLLAGLLAGLVGCSSDQSTDDAAKKTTEATTEKKQTSNPVAEPAKEAVMAWDNASLTARLAALPAGDIERGKQAHNDLLCISCHAVTGQPNSRNFVNLNHQPEKYLQKMMIDYRDDRRAENYGQAKIMTYIAKTLDDQQIADLAAFYASQSLPKGKDANYQADQATLNLVSQGDMSRMVMSCAACHGAQGQGNGDLFPALAGQEADYTIRTLKAYRTGERNNDVNGMMANIAKNLTDDEIAGLALYYENLNP